MPLTYEQVLMFLYGLVAVMLIIVLYHAVFIIVDVRKIVRRVERVTDDLQTVIMKPISVADQVMDYVMDLIKHKKHKGEKKHVPPRE